MVYRIQRAATALVAVVICALPSTAGADSNSMLTAGFGSNVGISSISQLGGETRYGLSNEISLRIRALYVLGVDFGYAPTDSTPPSGDELVFQNGLRLSALLYLIPTPVVAAYTKAGIEGASFGALVSVTDPSNSYHAGGGLDIQLGENLAITVEYLMLFPGFHSVQQQIESWVAQQQATVEAALSRGEDVPGDIGADAPTIGDYISPTNFRATLGVRWWF